MTPRRSKRKAPSEGSPRKAKSVKTESGCDANECGTVAMDISSADESPPNVSVVDFIRSDFDNLRSGAVTVESPSSLHLRAEQLSSGRPRSSISPPPVLEKIVEEDEEAVGEKTPPPLLFGRRGASSSPRKVVSNTAQEMTLYEEQSPMDEDYIEDIDVVSSSPVRVVKLQALYQREAQKTPLSVPNRNTPILHRVDTPATGSNRRKQKLVDEDDEDNNVIMVFRETTHTSRGKRRVVDLLKQEVPLDGRPPEPILFNKNRPMPGIVERTQPLAIRQSSTPVRPSKDTMPLLRDQKDDRGGGGGVRIGNLKFVPVPLQARHS